MADMKLYWCPQTRASRAVWMLEECGASYDLELIDVRDEDAKADAAFRAVSPMGKVPALVHGETMLTDSTAICAYLAETFPGAGLAPALGDAKRGAYHQWLVFAGTYIEPGMAEGFGSTTPNKISHGWGDWPSVLDMLEGGVSNTEYVLGDTFSAADVMVGSSAHFVRMFGLLKEDERPAIHAYIDRCTARPAFAKAQKLDADNALRAS